VILHRKFPLDLSFDDDGIGVRPWLAEPVSIAWHEVEFVCPVPTLERRPEGWRERRSAGFEFRSTLASSGMLALYVVVRDRRPVIARATGRTRRWARVWLRPMSDARDAPRPDQSLLRLELFVKKLGGSLDSLFDLLAAKARFDLVCFDF
jgi:hypothetical protein